MGKTKDSEGLSARFPRTAVGAVVFKDKKILLVQRRNAPQKGLWAVPGGSIKPGETLGEATEREIYEETGLSVRAGDPLHVFDLIERDRRGKLMFHYVIIDLAADLLGGRLAPADDARSAGWFTAPEAMNLPLSKSTLHLLQKIGFLA
jgi:ADP-ribose pyrophosphatase